jgi:galactokinase
LSALPDKLRAAFEKKYGTTPRIFRAPGRVNLIGEHTDYNGGFVLPAAIDLATYAAAAPRDDRRLVAASLELPGELDGELGQLRPQRNWTDYVAGVAAFGKVGQGANLLIASEVPIGGGLSSSAALEVSTALALGLGHLPRIELARLCQKAENEFAGMRCGIMDQFTSCLGRAGHALRIDCRKLSHHEVPVPDTVRLLIANTMVKHELAASAYNTRREECEEAARRFDVESLRDITPEDFQRRGHELPVPVRNRCQHVITENERVDRFISALRFGDLARAGRRMNESHQSLRDDFAVSCEELDLMVEIAGSIDGVYGARMTGGGFGGCTINLVDAPRVEAVREELSRRYEQATGIRPDIYVCQPSGGAAELLP